MQASEPQIPRPSKAHMIGFLFWALLIAVSVPSLFSAWGKAAGDQEYAYLPLALALFILLLILRWKEKPRLPKTFSHWLIVATGIGLFCSGITFNSPWLTASSSIFFLTGLLVSQSRGLVKPNFLGWLGRTNLLNGSLLALVPLLPILIPLPRDFLQKIVESTGRWTIVFSSFLLDGLGLPHFWQNEQLVLEEKTLDLSNQVPLLFSPLTCVFIMIAISVLRNRSAWLCPLYYLAGLVSCVVSRVIFVTSTAYLSEFYPFIINGWWNTALIAMIALVTLLFMLSLDRLFLVFFFSTQVDEFAKANPLVSAWNAAFSPESGEEPDGAGTQSNAFN